MEYELINPAPRTHSSQTIWRLVFAISNLYGAKVKDGDGVCLCLFLVAQKNGTRSNSGENSMKA